MVGEDEPLQTGSGSTALNPPETTQPTTVTTQPAPTWTAIPGERDITAQQAFVYDLSQREFVYMIGQPEDKVYPASITKIFTAYTALQYLSGEERITVGDELDMVGYGSSVADLEKGDVLTVDQLIEGMMLPSGNDASYILAVAAGRDIAGDPTLSPAAAAKAFLKEMNRTARSHGLSDTNFTNPDGYHADNHYTTMADLVELAKLALKTPSILRYTTISADTLVLDNGRELNWHNTNALIDPQSPWYCPVALGLKTGQTPRAGSCLLSAFNVDGKIIIIGVFGCPEEEGRFADTLQLLQMAMDGEWES
jgi:D-alanyl-D-alanine carboxypeptidase (penicillin-binding protein 5/6)